VACYGAHSTLNNTGDLIDWIDSAYSYLGMVDYPYPSDFLMPLPANPIKEVSSFSLLSISFFCNYSIVYLIKTLYMCMLLILVNLSV
jgi:hypothetical protein